MSYEDFVWFILSEEDKSNELSLEYWFRCVDLDCDGKLRPNEMLVCCVCSTVLVVITCFQTRQADARFGTCFSVAVFCSVATIRKHAWRLMWACEAALSIIAATCSTSTRSSCTGWSASARSRSSLRTCCARCTT